jgi:hypothetical protein
VVTTEAGIVVAFLDPQRELLATAALDASGAPRDVRVVERLERVDRHIALAAGAGRLALAWTDATGGRFRLATRASDGPHHTWSLEDVALPAFAGRDYRASEDFDVMVDTAGAPHLLFRDAERSELTHLWRPSGEDWQIETVDDGRTASLMGRCPPERREMGGEGVGYDPHAIAAPDGGVVVAYYDADCGDLRLARRRQRSWSPAIVDDGERDGDGSAADDVGRFPSVAIAPNGSTLHIAYSDRSRGQLTYAVGAAGTFTREVADAGLELDAFSQRRKHLVGAYASLALDERERPWIGYFDATATSLRVVARRGTDGEAIWSRETLDDEGVVGLHADHAYARSIGHVLVAERLVPREEGGGYASRLVLRILPPEQRP